MIKRTIEISREPAHLAVQHEQLLIKRDGQTVGQVPCEDIGVVLVDHPATTYTHRALATLAASDAAVVICGQDHLPAAMLLPMTDHSQVVWRLRDQLDASRPLKKQLWKQLVQAKIRAQAANLPGDSPAHKKLLALTRTVRSGDPSNVEAQAARWYWNNWLWQEEFRRDPDAPGVNAFLNYGYAVVRAAVARTIVAAVHPVSQDLAPRRVYAHAVFGLCSALCQPRERSSPHGPRRVPFAARRGSAGADDHRQAVRTDAGFLGQKTQTDRVAAMSDGTFLSAFSFQVVMLFAFGRAGV